MSARLLGSPGPSAHDIQSHLYLAFLEAKTADIALRVSGSWNAIYKLHRVVLIQSGFFRSLFTAGFSESVPRLHSHQLGPDPIDLVFDDRNITRAAFEVCISRLYGGGPQLYIPPDLIPTTTQPLSPSFFNGYSWSKRPDDHHPASPRFLLSLLATAIFLSIPTVASQALSYILSTIGPHTVIQYLNFAIGQPIDPRAVDEPEAAVGLEHIAQLVGHEEKALPLLTTSVNEDDNDVLSGAMSDLYVRKEDPADIHAASDSEESQSTNQDQPAFYYGAVSDKIGESCVCWLARWAPDILACEEILEGIEASTSSLYPGSSQMNCLTVNRSRSVATSLPFIWRRGGLSAKWVSVLVGADTLFVKGECERYEFARRVVELRRHGGVVEEEEIEWTRMFEHGIFYENMTMEDIIKVSQDVSDTTHSPFVPLPVLQAAHWRQSMLRHHITFRPSGSSPSFSSPATGSPPPREKELGITHATVDLASNTFEHESARTYFSIPVDSSLRLGENGNLLEEKLPSTMDELFRLLCNPSASSCSQNGTATARLNVRKSRVSTFASESTFFGLLPSRYTRSVCIQSDQSGGRKWSPYPPYRFAVEFWDLDYLKEKSRLHSHTVWYAGSLFNVYVQIVKKKGQAQLGIYLHRQSSIDPVPSPSAPSPLLCSDKTNETNERTIHAHKSPLSSVFVPNTPPPTHGVPTFRSTSRIVQSLPSSPSSPTMSSSLSPSTFGSGVYALPATANPVAPRQPYRDPRPSVSAYFTINCASAMGSTQTRFTSAPDVFSVSQSWGWKSSSLRTEEYVEVRDEGAGPRTVPLGSEVSLRATVVLGLV
ncbi:hypothetical protein AX17_000840 [Amanita inopinata Kibby_2008]|nr:hypothetical protein AX17_000840 [Amanita inopinata Kibby_2008]